MVLTNVASSIRVPVPRVLYESDRLLIVDKPIGIPYHDVTHHRPLNEHRGSPSPTPRPISPGPSALPSGPPVPSTSREISEPGLLSLIRGLQESDQFPYKGRLYGVHRLDRVTSGALIFAKNSETAGKLVNLFREKKVKKIYVALSDQRPLKKQGLVKGDLLPARDGCFKLSRTMADPSVTRFFSFGLQDPEHPSLRLFRLHPETGRTHQLRVVMKSLGSSIIGDRSYQYKGPFEPRFSSIGIGIYLHAAGLDFDLDGERVRILEPPTPAKNACISTGAKELLGMCQDPLLSTDEWALESASEYEAEDLFYQRAFVEGFQNFVASDERLWDI